MLERFSSRPKDGDSPGGLFHRSSCPARSRHPYDEFLSMETLARREDETSSPHQPPARGTQLFKVARPATCCYMMYIRVCWCKYSVMRTYVFYEQASPLKIVPLLFSNIDFHF
jgi:hypothetical protein